MAEDNKSKKRPVAKKTETLRQRTDRVTSDAQKPKSRRIRNTADTVAKPLHRLRHVAAKEYHVVPLPNNRLGRVLGKRVRLFPRFFLNAWKELLRVDWPNNILTLRLTFAVFIFALVFGTIITVVDFGLDKVFKQVFLK